MLTKKLSSARRANGLNSLMTNAKKIGYENIVFGADIVTSLETLGNINQELVLRTQWFEPAEVLRQATSKAGKLVALSGPRNPLRQAGCY